MKKFRRFVAAPILFLSAIQVTANADTYSATASSAHWFAFTSEQNGFSLKYPPEWSLHFEPVRAEIDGPNLSPRIIITRRPGTLSAEVAKLDKELQGALRVDVTKSKVNDLDAIHAQFARGYFDNGGAEMFDILFLEGNSSTYEITWTLGRGELKTAQTVKALCRELLGTFSQTEIKYSKSIDYTDPKHGFSLKYPREWHLANGGGMPNVIVRNGSKCSISVAVEYGSTLAEYVRFQAGQMSGVSEKRRLFAHGYIGRTCRWLGNEAYLFEWNGNLYILTTARVTPNERMAVDEVLNNFALPEARSK